MASIQVTRSNDLMYVAASASVTVNGQSVASLGRGERYVGVVRPGAVTVGAHAVTMPGTYSVRFNAQPGKTYRFVVSPRGESYMPSLVGGVIGSAIDAAVNENAGAFKIAAE